MNKTNSSCMIFGCDQLQMRLSTWQSTGKCMWCHDTDVECSRATCMSVRALVEKHMQRASKYQQELFYISYFTDYAVMIVPVLPFKAAFVCAREVIST